MINTLSAESEIRDLDFAEESSNLNRIKLLGKARTFAQVQAGITSKRVLDVLV
jgi:flagellin